MIIHRLHFLFQSDLHQSANMYNDDGNDISIGRDGKGDRDNSLKFIIVAICSCIVTRKVLFQVNTVTAL